MLLRRRLAITLPSKAADLVELCSFEQVTIVLSILYSGDVLTLILLIG